MAMALHGHNPVNAQSLGNGGHLINTPEMSTQAHQRPSSSSTEPRRPHSTNMHQEHQVSFSGEYTTTSIPHGEISRIQQKANSKIPPGILRPPSPDRGMILMHILKCVLL